MITITERFLDQKRPRDREEAEEFDEEYEGKVGKLMKKKDRARAVMDQKATSVADIAAVIGIQEQEKEEAAQKTGPDGEEKLAKTKAGQKRQRIAKRRAKAYEEAVKERVENFAKALSTPEVEYKIQVPEAVQDDQVKILWTDLQDAKYAQSWPESVRHGELRKMSHGHVMPDQRPGYAENVATEDTLEEPASA